MTQKLGAKIDVAICMDENLLVPAIVLISSIAEHATVQRPVRLFVVTTADPARLHAAFPHTDARPFTLVVLKVDNCFGSLPRNDYITQGTYLRFLLPELLPDVSKLLYLDIDMIVNRDIAVLFDEPLNGMGLGAAADVAMLVGSPHWNNYSIKYKNSQHTFIGYIRDILQISEAGGDEYFNAGLLLIDLNFWRREGIVAKVMAYLSQMPSLVFMDQDALSHVFAGNYVRLDTRWNAFASCAYPALSKLKLLFARHLRNWEAARGIWRTDPWIVHYAGPTKPWEAHKPPVPLSDLWWSYARRSPAWPDLEHTYAEKKRLENERRHLKKKWGLFVR